MPTPATNAEKYRTYGESRVDYYDTFYQEAYARAMAEYKDETAARKIALEATNREILQAQRDMADLNEALLKSGSSSRRRDYEDTSSLTRLLALRQDALQGDQRTRAQMETAALAKYNVPPSLGGKLGDLNTKNAAESNADRREANMLNAIDADAGDLATLTPEALQAYGVQAVQSVAPAERDAARRAVGAKLGIDAAQLTPEALENSKRKAQASAGKYDIGVDPNITALVNELTAKRSTAKLTEEEDAALLAAADTYLNGKKPVKVEDGTTLDEDGNEIPRFKDGFAVDDTYSRMQQALADGSFDQKDMDELGLTAEDFAKHTALGRVIEMYPAKFSASDRSNFSSAKMELLKKQAALGTQLRDLKDNVPKMKSEQEIRAESVARAEPYQKNAPGEGLRLALGIQSRPLRQMDRQAAFAQQSSATGSGPLSTLRASLRPVPVQAPAPMPELSDEQKLLVGGSRIAQSAGYKPTEDEDKFAKAIAARRANGTYQKGELVKMAVASATGSDGVVDTAKRDRLLAAYAYEFALGKKGTKPAEASAPKEAKPVEAAPAVGASGKLVAPKYKMSQETEATLNILSDKRTKVTHSLFDSDTPAKRRQLANITREIDRIVADVKAQNARVFEPSPTGVVNDQSRFMMGPEAQGSLDAGASRFERMLKKVGNLPAIIPFDNRPGPKDAVRPTPPIEAEDPTFNDDIQNIERIPTFEEMKAENHNLRQDEYDEYIQRTYRSK